MEKTGDAEKKGAAEAVSGAVSKKATQGGHGRVEAGRVYIKSSYNNTMITVTDEKGGVVAWASAGSLGFAGPKKATPFAASKVTSAIVEKITKTGPHVVDIYISGIGPGRDSAVRSIASSGFDILSINDVTPIPHNGPRPRKARRV
ncbi:MAG: 30S ribosomal protein S11 [Candidatus Colwellbacteria bacterium RIFCSPHIGHO2_02_FULL_45_17]|uniref:Small ribosomal subunit protein uS11 n=2 Tax=Candidatus Colwelliibacteriota TaxID=1817904 RepID=A0A1G1ZEJ5_9BACT|nr:MAG: 30S ribosomal protein S11 [Candidatus Colwellbacteria bacterium RIFCSPHIGHO2_02_FULL_45_17]OGY61069.1 MAG: 30S ribosomal protein S11 [Candidatus Colwellbacteria bacterium RIFCSPLOWO2_02_FULL_45_11]OGY62556.1 MAG: 30S ribosomal protein S11 [Candidatus Colwellbacteria bacterium RIFCSPLOWO2_12_FULL_46_17]